MALACNLLYFWIYASNHSMSSSLSPSSSSPASLWVLQSLKLTRYQPLSFLSSPSCRCQGFLSSQPPSHPSLLSISGCDEYLYTQIFWYKYIQIFIHIQISMCNKHLIWIFLNICLYQNFIFVTPRFKCVRVGNIGGGGGQYGHQLTGIPSY